MIAETEQATQDVVEQDIRHVPIPDAAGTAFPVTHAAAPAPITTSHVKYVWEKVLKSVNFVATPALHRASAPIHTQPA